MLLSVFNVNAQNTLDGVTEEIHINWQSTFKNAVAEAKKEHKPILIYFTGSDWCGPCIQLDKNLFHTKKFATFSAQNLVLYTADYPRNRDLVSTENKIANQQLSKKYKQTSFPTILMIDENGEMLGRKEGAYMASYYYPFFEEIVKSHKK